MSKQLLESVVKSLQPTFAEHQQEYMNCYWDSYSKELYAVLHHGGESKRDLIVYLNRIMRDHLSNHPHYHACCDVASTLQSADSSYAGVFKFN